MRAAGDAVDPVLGQQGGGETTDVSLATDEHDSVRRGRCSHSVFLRAARGAEEGKEGGGPAAVLQVLLVHSRCPVEIALSRL